MHFLYFDSGFGLLRASKKISMEAVKIADFLNNVEHIQLAQWHKQEDQIFRSLILPTIILEPTICNYTHFLTLQGTTKLYVSMDMIYQNHGNYISRKLKNVRYYTDQLEMHFYMSLLEYENTLEPNPVLFNGKGTREDAIDHFINLRVVAHHAIFTPNLN